MAGLARRVDGVAEDDGAQGRRSDDHGHLRFLRNRRGDQVRERDPSERRRSDRSCDPLHQDTYQSASRVLSFRSKAMKLMNKTLTAAAAFVVSLAAASGADSDIRAQAQRIVSQIQRADYEGDRTALKKYYDELTPFLENKKLASRIRYWRGFDLWRSAINGFNDSVDPNELERLFMQAVDEFKDAAARDPAFIDAKVGMISCLGYVTYIHRKEPERMQELMTRITPLIKEAQAAEPDNPRLS